MTAPSTKKCSGCKAILSTDNFHKSKTFRDGLSVHCKSCAKVLHAAAHKRRVARIKLHPPEQRCCIRCNETKPTSDYYKCSAQRDGLSNVCKTCESEACSDYGARNKDVLAKKASERFRQLRLDAVTAYGGKCVCCGESSFQFIAIDHTNGGGRKQLRENGIDRSSFCRWLKKNNYPQDTFRALCHNCNMALGLYGYCPHGGVEPTVTELFLPCRGPRAAKRRFAYKQRNAVLSAYGGACSCCGEDQYEFLAMDHVDGGGTKHIKSLTISLAEYLYKNNYPPGFQVLCHNCNLAKGFYGNCPHKENVSCP